MITNLLLNITLAKGITTKSYFFSMFFDPIEQYDLSWILLFGWNIYPIYFHACLIAFFLLFILSQLQLTIFGYLHYKIYNFIKEAFLAVCGSERQILFPYFYYLFFFLW